MITTWYKNYYQIIFIFLSNKNQMVYKDGINNYETISNWLSKNEQKIIK